MSFDGAEEKPEHPDAHRGDRGGWLEPLTDAAGCSRIISTHRIDGAQSASSNSAAHARDHRGFRPKRRRGLGRHSIILRGTAARTGRAPRCGRDLRMAEELQSRRRVRFSRMRSTSVCMRSRRPVAVGVRRAHVAVFGDLAEGAVASVVVARHARRRRWLGRLRSGLNLGSNAMTLAAARSARRGHLLSAARARSPD